MNASIAYARLRTNGDVAFAVALAGCLLVPNWPLGVLIAFLFLLFATSCFRSIVRSARDWNLEFHKLNKGWYANYRIAQTIALLFMVLYHRDGPGEIETYLKVLLANYIIALNFDRYRWEAVVCGAAAGAILAFAFGMFQIGVELMYRSEGTTNAVRFGMVSLALGSVCAVGFLHAGGNRGMALLSVAGFAAGVGAAFASGSRGAVLALPFALLLLGPVLWKRSRRAFVSVAAFLTVFVGMLFAVDVGNMSTRLTSAYTNVSTMLADPAGDPSFGERAKLLMLAYELFTEHPLAGVGVEGWNAAAEKLAAAPDPGDRIIIPYNQAHSQYADDLAKGGIIRFLLGLTVFLLPLYLFLQGQPFADRQDSRFALAGVVVTIVFMVYCLTESVMILSITALIYSMLTVFLLAGCDETRQQSLAGKVASSRVLQSAG